MNATLLFLGFVSYASAIELTKETWDDATSGKVVFVMFKAPWCGQCKRMKPDWDKMMDEYQNHENIVIADVDCTAGGKELCDEMDVEGFPSLQHGDPNNLENYGGDHDLKALRKFARTLVPLCGPENLELCDEDQTTLINKYLEMSEEDIAKSVKEKDAAIIKASEDFEELVTYLNNQYEESKKSIEEKKSALREVKLGMMKAVLAHRKRKSRPELNERKSRAELNDRSSRPDLKEKSSKVELNEKSSKVELNENNSSKTQSLEDSTEI